MNTLKKIGPVVMVLIALAITTGSATAQDRILARVEIPFSFSAFDQTFSPGLYDVKQIGTHVIRLRHAATNNGVTLLTPQSIAESSTTTIVFRDYGSEKFLAAVIAPSYQVRIAASRRETEVAKSMRSPVREFALK